MKNFKFIFSTVIIALFAFSCNRHPNQLKSNDLANYISKNNTNIISFYPINLIKKSGIKNISDLTPSKNKKDDFLFKIMKDHRKSGLDFINKAYLTMDSKKDLFSKGKGSPIKASIYFPIKDITAWEKMARDVNDLQSNKIDGINYQIKADSSIILWNKNMVLLSKLNPEVSVADYINKFKVKKEDSVLFEPTYLKSTAGNHDIYIWTNSTQQFKDLQKLLPQNLPSMFNGFDKKDNFSYGYIDFLAGKIKMDFTNEFNKNFNKILNNIFELNSNTALIQDLPKENLIGFLNISLNFDGIKELLETIPELNNASNPVSLNSPMVSNVFKGFKGQIGLAFYNTENEKPEVIANLKIKDKEVVFDLLDELMETSMIQKEGNTYSVLGKAYFSINDDYISLSMSEKVQKYLATNSFSTIKEMSTPQTFVDPSYFSLFIDLDKLTDIIPEGFEGLDNLILNYKKKQNLIELNFVDKSSNSLQNIIELIKHADKLPTKRM